LQGVTVENQGRNLKRSFWLQVVTSIFPRLFLSGGWVQHPLGTHVQAAVASQFSAWTFLQAPRSSKRRFSGAMWACAKLLERESLRGGKPVQAGLRKPRPRRGL